jgi:chemotaxis protein MotB
MAKKHKCPDPPMGAPMWMTTFSDMVTLLLAFFVMLLSFSSIQESKFQEAVHSLKGAFGVMVSPASVIQQPEVVLPRADTNEWQQMLYEIQQMRMILAEEELADEVRLSMEKDGISIQISTPFLFQPASDALRDRSKPILERLATALGRLSSEIRVEGHTDNVPISSDEFPSNWELSTARALSVVKYFQRSGLAPERLAAVGFGEFRPIAPNDSETGRRENRRVEILVRRDSELASSLQAEGEQPIAEESRGGR